MSSVIVDAFECRRQRWLVSEVPPILLTRADGVIE